MTHLLMSTLWPKPLTPHLLDISKIQIHSLIQSLGPIPIACLAFLLTFPIGHARVTFRKRRLGFFFPFWVYDLIDHALFIPNWLITAACYWQPSSFLDKEASCWNEVETQSLVGPEVVAKQADTNGKVKELILSRKSASFKEIDLVRLYDALPVTKAEEMIGKGFHGRILRTNKSVLDFAEWLLVKPLTLLGFGWGKRYCTQHVGDPLLVNWLGLVYFPLPLWGNVSMVDVAWRGKASACMVYNQQPWFDYFRGPLGKDVNGRSVYLGVWTSKDRAGGWFTLAYDDTVPV